MSDGLRIVDAVFARQPASRRPARRVLPAILVGVGLHALAVLFAIASAPSLETWSAGLATRVHAELTREEIIELPPQPKPEPPPPPPEAPPPPAAPRRTPVATPRAAPARPRPPAQAGRLVTADPAVADLPDTAFVSGNAPTYAGGVTTAAGTSATAVTGPVQAGPLADDPAAHTPRAEDRSAPVAIDDIDWSDCPFPPQADRDGVDEQWVVLQVAVKADGASERVTVVRDPGHGFGAQARACALGKRFRPARDRQGHPMAAESPAFRVHFIR